MEKQFFFAISIDRVCFAIEMCINFFFEDDGVGCVYNFVTSAIPVAKNPIWKEMAADTS
jgi:hypothetical protein